MKTTEIKTVKYTYFDYNTNSKGNKIKSMYDKIRELKSNFGFYQDDKFYNDVDLKAKLQTGVIRTNDVDQPQKVSKF